MMRLLTNRIGELDSALVEKRDALQKPSAIWINGAERGWYGSLVYQRTGRCVCRCVTAGARSITREKAVNCVRCAFCVCECVGTKSDLGTVTVRLCFEQCFVFVAL